MIVSYSVPAAIRLRVALYGSRKSCSFATLANSAASSGAVPVVTLLYPSLGAAFSARDTFGIVCPSLTPVDGIFSGLATSELDTKYDGVVQRLFFPPSPQDKIAPRSLMSQCAATGTLLHFLSWDREDGPDDARRFDGGSSAAAELLGVSHHVPRCESDLVVPSDAERIHHDVLLRLSLHLSDRLVLSTEDRLVVWYQRAYLWAKARYLNAVGQMPPSSESVLPTWKIKASDLFLGSRSTSPYCLSGIAVPIVRGTEFRAQSVGGCQLTTEGVVQFPAPVVSRSEERERCCGRFRQQEGITA
mmetsp:Transcript_29402/g.67617  ORF Transcript_29402/g.67617 Transcript_29402/m.67617 type:complete len:302 (-) Transcript_29402:812-1717(-)